tara:strand:+ start:149 stop:955 length:807 start_codon:yes stop_codon:yes gene_type:complete
MAIEMEKLQTFFWQQFTEFVTSNPNNADFPKTQMSIEDDTLVISHPDGGMSSKYVFRLPLGQGKLSVQFKLKDEWKHLEHGYVQTIRGSSFVNVLLAAYSEHIGEFIAGVPVAVEFSDEEWAEIDEARKEMGQTREEFVQTAIKNKLAKLANTERLFKEKLVEHFGGGFIVRRFTSTKDQCRFVVGEKGSEVYIDKVKAVIAEQGSFEGDVTKAARKIDALVEESIEAGTPNWLYITADIGNDPFVNGALQDDWVSAIAKMFKGFKPN